MHPYNIFQSSFILCISIEYTELKKFTKEVPVKQFFLFR